MFDFLKYLPTLLEATVLTVEITVMGFSLAVVVAMIAGTARLARSWIVRWVARVYVEIFRGAPALLILFWIYYALPHFGVTLDALTAAVIGLGLNAGAYGSEVVRGALLAVPKGQHEAATALNFAPRQRLTRVILPQALIMMMPPFGNLAIEFLKSTALVSLITITELTSRAVQLNNINFRPMEVFVLVLAIYFVLALGITAVMRTIEARLNRSLGREGRPS
ncbi:MAG: ectoine/hydroxyectoine ABC transporter permease subunit EhuC [Rhodospirillaceae bacterium]|nr:ectoine/hydroxyectoine ABC transporter permease subunit EhuC [Rhodospirillaceae bacterium]